MLARRRFLPPGRGGDTIVQPMAALVYVCVSRYINAAEYSKGYQN